jgi:hypothetical protein
VSGEKAIKESTTRKENPMTKQERLDEVRALLLKDKHDGKPMNGALYTEMVALSKEVWKDAIKAHP